MSTVQIDLSRAYLSASAINKHKTSDWSKTRENAEMEPASFSSLLTLNESIYKINFQMESQPTLAVEKPRIRD